MFNGMYILSLSTAQVLKWIRSASASLSRHVLDHEFMHFGFLLETQPYTTNTSTPNPIYPQASPQRAFPLITAVAPTARP